jgi:hypothetical protein
LRGTEVIPPPYKLTNSFFVTYLGLWRESYKTMAQFQWQVLYYINCYCKSFKLW